jgi:hypothetical protein
MKKVLVVLVLLVVAYGVGFWGEYRKRTVVEGELARQQAQLTEAQERVRSAELLGQVLNLKDVAAARNYGQAQELSTKLFDTMRAESGQVSRVGGLAAALEAVLGMRDAVTAALTRSDPAAVDVIQQAEARLRQGLGYAVAPRPTPASSPSSSASPSPAASGIP